MISTDFLTNKKYMVLITIAVTLLLLMTFPTTAYAWPIEDLQNWVKDDILIGSAENMLNSSIDITNWLGVDDFLTAPFDRLLSPNSGDKSTTYTVISGVQTSAIALGKSILALALLMQMVKISQRVDAQQTIPMLKEIVVLVVFFLVFSWLIDHSWDICSAAYDEINKLIESIYSGNAAESMGRMKFGDSSNVTISAALLLLIVMLFMWLVSLIACVVAYAMVLARAIQLYILAALSPIPFALLGFEETRQMGIGFCKNFLAVALAGLILACLILIYPGLIGDILVASGISYDNGSTYQIELESVVLSVIPIIAVSAMYLLACIKSGSWARDLLGG